MPHKIFLIGPMQDGWINRVEPFFIPEKAFFELEDVYVWRGKVRKRFGYSLIGATDLDSRLRINVGTTDGSGNIVDVAPGSSFAIGQMFSIGTEVFTVNSLGTPATMLISGSATLATFDTTTGAVTINGAAPNTDLFYFPAQPVMGLRTRETSNINAERVIAFDQQFAYERSGGGWERIGTAVWTGSDAQFFWSVNYRGADPFDTFFYVVNNNADDNIKFLPSGSSTWIDLRPQLDSGATRFLETSKVLINFKDRLLALNTVEDTAKNNYQNRVRFSQNGDPTNELTSWLDTVPGKGGFIDAPTQEAIISAERLRDRLIVYFERSTWNLVYTKNESAPFKWEQLNDELGCESSFSIIGFDKKVLGVGNVGVHDCNGVNVTRIDGKIPNEVFKIHNGNSGPERVYGIRDFFNELVYWAFPEASAKTNDEDDGPTFPTRILLYNYENNTWSLFNDSFTCFGYFQGETDLKWSELGTKYGIWTAWNTPWGSPLFQSSFPLIIAGNQEGWVFTIDNEKSSNSQSLSITDMSAPSTLVVVNHNLKVGDYILVEEATGITSLNGIIIRVETIIDKDTITVDVDFSGTYTGNGKLARISNMKILSKQFNPGTPVGLEFRISFADFLLDRTSDGEVTLEYFINTTNNDTITDMTEEGILLGNNVLFTRPEDDQTFQPNQQQIWHRYYIQSEGAFIQLVFFLSDDQMRNRLISQSDFQLHAILLYIEAEGRIIG